MTNSRNKEQLGETARNYLTDLWVSEKLGRKNFAAVNKYTQKGVMVESDSLELVSQYYGKPLFKNQRTFENDYIIGTPDVAEPLIDIKSSWDIYTFFRTDRDSALKSYYWQLAGYMYLLGRSEATLIFALADTPEELISDEQYRLSRYLPDTDLDALTKNFTYDDIPLKMRVREYPVQLAEDDIEKIKEKVNLCRQFLAQLDKENNA
jgi:hypothetical protein